MEISLKVTSDKTILLAETPFVIVVYITYDHFYK